MRVFLNTCMGMQVYCARNKAVIFGVSTNELMLKPILIATGPNGVPEDTRGLEKKQCAAGPCPKRCASIISVQLQFCGLVGSCCQHLIAHATGLASKHYCIIMKTGVPSYSAKCRYIVCSAEPAGMSVVFIGEKLSNLLLFKHRAATLAAVGQGHTFGCIGSARSTTHPPGVILPRRGHHHCSARGSSKKLHSQTNGCN